MKTEDRGEDPRKKSSRESCKMAGRNVTGLLENSQAKEEEEGFFPSSQNNSEKWNRSF